MRWKSGRRSANVEDLRGSRVPRGVSVGGGVLVLALLASLLLGEDPNEVLRDLAGSQAEAPRTPPSQDDEASQFVSVVLADTEDVWGTLFQQSGQDYPEPTLVLFTDAVQSACGYNTAATGPFYCPADQQVYLDLGFLNELRRLDAPGDFAFAYVIAHEVGHHIQTITGISNQVRQLQRRSSQVEANQLSVFQELQADCFAGLWARHAHEARNILEDGDVEEGLRAAASIGDDRLQRMSGRRVQPESFTHGTSEQRVQWFRRGLNTGSFEACDTFSESNI